jgi:hypothetical protein
VPSRDAECGLWADGVQVHQWKLFVVLQSRAHFVAHHPAQVGQRQLASGEPFDCSQHVGIDVARAHRGSSGAGSSRKCEFGWVASPSLWDDHFFSQLRDAVKAIILYACKPVDRDARRGQSDCNVVGSDSDQVYTYGTTPGSTPIDFGKWEGRVFLIAPNGNHQEIDPDFSLPD